MNYWLVKSEPFKYSWDKFAADGQTCWDGVRSYPGRLHLRGMKKGDLVLFYHSMEGLEVVGIAKVSKQAYQDPTTEEDWSAVDLKVYKKLKKPVPLTLLKKEKSLANIPLIRIPRLSVMPLKEVEFNKIVEMGT